MPSPLHVRALAARTWRTISSVWRSSRASPTRRHGVSGSFAIQAGREIRIIVNPEKVSDDKMVLLAREIAKKIENELDYPGQIKVNMVRETRAIDYAK